MSEQLHLRYEVAQPFWMNRWLSVSDTQSGLLRVGAVSGSSLQPLDAPDDFFADVSIDASSGDCDVVASECASEQRVTLDFVADEGLALDVVDGHAIVHDFNHVHYALISVQTAAEYSEPVMCSDLPGAWYEFSFMRAAHPD